MARKLPADIAFDSVPSGGDVRFEGVTSDQIPIQDLYDAHMTARYGSPSGSAPRKLPADVSFDAPAPVVPEIPAPGASIAQQSTFEPFEPVDAGLPPIPAGPVVPTPPIPAGPVVPTPPIPAGPVVPTPLDMPDEWFGQVVPQEQAPMVPARPEWSVDNTLRAPVARINEIISGIPRQLEDVMANTERHWPLGRIGVVDDDGFHIWKPWNPDEESTAIGQAADWIKSLDAGYQPSQAMDTNALEQQWIAASEDPRAYPKALADTAKFMSEGGVQSLADMFVIMRSMPTWILSQSNQYAREHARADGRETPTTEDLAFGLVTAGVVGGWERLGAETVFSPTQAKQLRDIPIEAAPKAGTEFGTEFGQTLAEEAGTKIGTEKGINAEESLKQAGWAGVTGAGVGGVAGSAQPAYSVLRNYMDGLERAALAELENLYAQTVKPQPTIGPDEGALSETPIAPSSTDRPANPPQETGAPGSPGGATQLGPTAAGSGQDVPGPVPINTGQGLQQEPGATGTTQEAPGQPVAPPPVMSAASPSGTATPNPAPPVATAAGTQIESNWEVLDVHDLITSSDERFDQRLQPRDRTRGTSEEQIRDMANNLDPARLGASFEADRGAPIVGPDNMVESGNGRTSAISQIYSTNPEKAKAYRDWLAQQGYNTEGIEAPILVRRRTTPFTDEQRRQFVIEANQAATASMGATEQAQVDADLIDDALLALYAGDGADLTAMVNDDFVREFARRIPVQERSAFFGPDNRISQDGMRRVHNAILAKAYGRSAATRQTLLTMMESTDNNTRAITSGLLGAAAKMARLQAQIDADQVPAVFGISDQIGQAASSVAAARAEGLNINDLLDQQGLFGDRDPLVDLLIRMFYNQDASGRLGRAVSSKEATERLAKYADRATAQRANQGSLLDTAPVTPVDLVKQIIAEGSAENQPTQAGIFDAPAPEPKPRGEEPEGTNDDLEWRPLQGARTSKAKGPEVTITERGGGQAVVSYEFIRDDVTGEVRIRRTIKYDDGETSSGELFERKNGDEVWGEPGPAEMGVIFPSVDGALKAINDDIKSMDKGKAAEEETQYAQENENGIVPTDDPLVEASEYPAPKSGPMRYARVHVAQIAEDKWLAAHEFEHNQGGHSSPLTTTFGVYPTRQEALDGGHAHLASQLSVEAREATSPKTREAASKAREWAIDQLSPSARKEWDELMGPEPEEEAGSDLRLNENDLVESITIPGDQDIPDVRVNWYITDADDGFVVYEEVIEGDNPADVSVAGEGEVFWHIEDDSNAAKRYETEMEAEDVVARQLASWKKSASEGERAARERAGALGLPKQFFGPNGRRTGLAHADLSALSDTELRFLGSKLTGKPIQKTARGPALVNRVWEMLNMWFDARDFTYADWDEVPKKDAGSGGYNRRTQWGLETWARTFGLAGISKPAKELRDIVREHKESIDPLLKPEVGEENLDNEYRGPNAAEPEPADAEPDKSDLDQWLEDNIEPEYHGKLRREIKMVFNELEPTEKYLEHFTRGYIQGILGSNKIGEKFFPFDLAYQQAQFDLDDPQAPKYFDLFTSDAIKKRMGLVREWQDKTAASLESRGRHAWEQEEPEDKPEERPQEKAGEKVFEIPMDTVDADLIDLSDLADALEAAGFTKYDVTDLLSPLIDIDGESFNWDSPYLQLLDIPTWRKDGGKVREALEAKGFKIQEPQTFSEEMGFDALQRKKKKVSKRRPARFTMRQGRMESSTYTDVWEGSGFAEAEIEAMPADRKFRVLRRILMQRFGFKDIKKGTRLNWNEANDNLQDAYTSLTNMAAVLGVHHKFMSLDGKITLLLESGHTENYLGAFYSGTNELSVVRRNDTFGHEWSHALDWTLLKEYAADLGKLDTHGGRALSGQLRNRNPEMTLPWHVQDAYYSLLRSLFQDEAKTAAEIMQLELQLVQTAAPSARSKIEAKIRNLEKGRSRLKGIASQMFTNARMLDQSGSTGVESDKKNYWSRPTEMMARAFEAYLAHKTAQARTGQEFIAQADYMYRESSIPGFELAYPHDSERELIFDSFDYLFNAMRDNQIYQTLDLGNEDPADVLLPGHAADVVDAGQANTNQAQKDFSAESRRFKNDRRNKKAAHDREMDAVARAHLGDDATKFRKEMFRLGRFVESLFHGWGYTIRGEYLEAAKRFKNASSIRWLQERIATDPGSGKFQRRTYDQAQRQDWKRFGNAWGKISRKYKLHRRSDEELRQMRDLLAIDDAESSQEWNDAPGWMKSAVGATRRLLNDLHVYQTEHGINLGFNKQYFMRTIDRAKLDTHEDRIRFVNEATRVYQIVFDDEVGTLEEILEDEEKQEYFGRQGHQLFKDDPTGEVRSTLKKITKLKGKRRDLEKKLTDPEAEPDDIQAKIAQINKEIADLYEKIYDQVRDAWAREGATDYLNALTGSVVLDEPFNGGQGAPSSHTKTRALPPEADRILGDFYITDPREVMGTYINRAVRAATMTEFFGGNEASRKEITAFIEANYPDVAEDLVRESIPARIGWKATVAFLAMERQGVPVSDLEALKEGYDYVVGDLRPLLTSTALRRVSRINTYVLPIFLVKALWSQIAEPATIGLRAQDPLATFRAFGAQLQDAMVAMHVAPGFVKDRVAFRKALGEMMGIYADAFTDQLMHSRFNLLYDNSQDRRMMSNFFRFTGQHAHTASMQRAAMMEALRYSQKQARRILKDPGNLAARSELNELGLDAENQRLMQFLAEMGTGKQASLAELKNPEFVRDIELALGRFTNQAIQEPSAVDRPRWASKPGLNFAYAITAFASAFGRNATIANLKRLGRAGKSLVKPEAGGLGRKGAARYAVTIPTSLAMLMAMQWGITFLRHLASSDDDWDETEEKFTRDWLRIAVSRTGLLGLADVPFNAWMGVKYNRSIAEMGVGPLIGFLASGTQTGLTLFSERNSKNTITTERKMSEFLYQLGIGMMMRHPLAGGGFFGLHSKLATYTAFMLGFPAMSSKRVKQHVTEPTAKAISKVTD